MQVSDLIRAVTDGILEQRKSVKQETPVGGSLGKDAFLQLLVTQMKYQDPLNPNTDTEYIAQLATFSQLEQLQNIGELTSKSQALNLVGKNVIVRTEGKNGEIDYVSGKVDYVTLQGGKTNLSINGKLYNVDQLDSVIDEIYIIEKGLPRIEKDVELTYDPAKPQDLSFEIFMGEGEFAASAVAIILDEAIIDSKFVNIKDGKLTISKEAFADFEEGDYPIIIAFNDPYKTIIGDKITLKVKASEPLTV
ncbi:MAG: hypothetical protein GX288_10570 [Clostridiales bacterium]|nr:hypothetical protein [Clostridiales bacterium]